MNAFPEIQSAKVNRLTSKVVDMHGRQTKNSGDATDPQDLVTLSQLNAAIENVQPQVKTTSQGGTSVSINTTGSNLAITLYILGSGVSAVTPDLANGFNQKLTLTLSSSVTINNPIFTGTGLTPGCPLKLFILMDSVGNRPNLTWGSAFGNDITQVVLDGTPNTQSVINARYMDDNKWHLDSTFLTGQLQ